MSWCRNWQSVVARMRRPFASHRLFATAAFYERLALRQLLDPRSTLLQCTTSVVPEPLPTTTSINSPVTPSPALGRSSLSLSLTRSTSRDTDGATTSSGIVRLLKTSAKAVQGFPRQSRDGPDEIPASANLVAALVQVRLHVHLAPLFVDNSSCAMQAPLSVSVSVPKATARICVTSTSGMLTRTLVP